MSRGGFVQNGIMLLPPVVAAVAPTIVLIGSKGNQVSSAAFSTGAGTSTSGKFLIVSTFDGVRNVSSLIDSKGNTYTTIGSGKQANGDAGCQMWLCESGTGGAGHTATIDYGANAFGVLWLYQILGAQATALDQTAQGNDSADPYTLTSPTLSQAVELVVCVLGTDASGTHAYSSGNMTIVGEEQDGSTYFGGCVGSLATAATTAVTPSYTFVGATTQTGALVLATFKA